MDYGSLEQQRIESPQVFLLSSFELQKHDFLLLHKTLERELPEHKRYALLMAMPSINLEIIKKKKEAFQAEIKYYATLSAAVAGVPVPGLSVSVDTVLLVGVVTRYVVGFGLDIPSLQRLVTDGRHSTNQVLPELVTFSPGADLFSTSQPSKCNEVFQRHSSSDDALDAERQQHSLQWRFVLPSSRRRPASRQCLVGSRLPYPSGY
ncbi:hypothetical protein Q8A73_012411 [Channa argus]|nr:hypothetical protein Q8A73_012411 [Channa argus]